MDCHVTNWGNQPIKLKVDVASMGKLGFDVDVSHMDGKDLDFTKHAIKNYNGFKHMVLHGEQYRLASPYENPFAALMYVDENQSQAIMFSYLSSNRFMERITKRPIKLKGLHNDRKYRVKEINLYPGTKSTIDESTVYSGDFLMTVGINPEIDVKRTSVVLLINEVE